MDPVSNPNKTRVVVIMEHIDKKGNSEILKHCTIPLTGKACVSMVITELVSKNRGQRARTRTDSPTRGDPHRHGRIRAATRCKQNARRTLNGACNSHQPPTNSNCEDVQSQIS